MVVECLLVFLSSGKNKSHNRERYNVSIKVNSIELVVQLSGNIDMASTLPINSLYVH
jgi:hypothetical protein